jgi:hypothetical protein
MNAAAPAYRRAQTWLTLWVAGLGLLGVGLVVLGRGDAEGATGALPGALVMAACVIGGLLCLGRLVVEVHPGELRWHFGYVGWPAWRQPLAEVAGTQQVRTRFIHGAGIRGSRQHRFYTVTPGGPALCLHLHDGRTVTLGVADPRGLAEAIDAQRRAG